MLEHAEVSIQEAESLAASSTLAKEDAATASIKRGIALVRAQWAQDELPADVRRLAKNIVDLTEALGLQIGRVEEILNHCKGQRGGRHPSNLSPCATVVQYMFDAEKQRMIRLLGNERASTGVLISDEVDVPGDVDRTLFRSAILLPAASARE
jgi:hypothetical protein